MEIVTVTGGKIHPIEVCRLVEPSRDSLGQVTWAGVLQSRGVKVGLAQAQGQSDEVWVQGRDAAGGGHRAVPPG